MVNFYFCIWLVAGGFCYGEEGWEKVKWKSRLVGAGIHMKWGEGVPHEIPLEVEEDKEPEQPGGDLKEEEDEIPIDIIKNAPVIRND